MEGLSIQEIKEFIEKINFGNDISKYILLKFPFKLLKAIRKAANRLSETNSGNSEELIIDILYTYLKCNFEIKSNEEPNIMSWKNIYITSPSDNIHYYTQWYLVANRNRSRALVIYNYDKKIFYSPSVDFNNFKMMCDFNPIFWMPLHISPWLPVNRKIDHKLTNKIYERDNYTCRLCGKCSHANRNIKLHVDHIFPYSKGGYHEENNLQILCDSCNSLKKDKVN